MKVWLDTDFMRPPENAGGDCDDCADCNDCFSPLTASFSTYQENSDDIQARIFQQAPLLHVQQCQEDGWLVCNPTSTGQVVVMDAQAFALFERFQTPTTLNDVLQKDKTASLSANSKLVTLFHKAGFLHTMQQRSDERQWNDSETLSAWLH